MVRNNHLKIKESDEKTCNNLETYFQEYLLTLSNNNRTMAF